MRAILHWALAPMALLLLAGCGDGALKTGSDKAATATPSQETLAAAVRSDSGYGALSRVIDGAGLATALDGVGPYTLFAPPEAALKAGGDFADPATKAEGAALLKAHIVPGAVTRADIAAAVDRGGAKGAQMRTMAGDLLTFTRQGQDIVAAAADGAQARLSGTETLVKNGVLQPVDALLAKPIVTPG